MAGVLLDIRMTCLSRLYSVINKKHFRQHFYCITFYHDMKDKNLITNKILPIHSRQRQRTMLVGLIRLLFCAHLVNLNGQNNSSLIKPMIALLLSTCTDITRHFGSRSLNQYKTGLLGFPHWAIQ